VGAFVFFACLGERPDKAFVNARHVLLHSDSGEDAGLGQVCSVVNAPI
jgi:hypothetical protein